MAIVTPNIEVRATAKYIRISPRKVRLVVDAVRGKRVNDALAMLRFMPQKSAREVYKVIQSAAANAENNYGLDPEDLYVSRIYADEGPTRRWRRFGARGRFKPLLKRSSHVTVVLAEYGSEEEE